MVKIKSWLERRKNGTVTTPLGFCAAGMHAGIKKKKKRFDTALIYSKTPCVAAATFTTNRVKAWPVLHSMKSVAAARHHAILASSGNANCVNGPNGKTAVQDTVREAAGLLKVPEDAVLIAQTGIIGIPFPITCLKRALPKLVNRLSPDGGRCAAKGIMTTDLAVKEVAVSFSLGGKRVTIGACAKGAGMVHPNMATMLCFITTDAAITKPLLRRAIRHAADDTFNKMAIDNDQSTNDTVFILANGESHAPMIQKIDRDYRLFRDALEEVCRIMTYKMVDDGEGVTHVCTLRVAGAKNPTEAERAARQVANSMLFKTMLAGADPNWGRIVAAIGASGVTFNLNHLSVAFGEAVIVNHGRLKVLNIPKARRVLQHRYYAMDIVIGKGRGKVEFVTSDLTAKYVAINSSYS
ncbi:MAG: bifunctional glutamate N-acetyltransferase/amino-acid acetyltransferase ArgJ [Candidatus Omnitrophota bacterium]|jgi:glutamate N-acetyltransferase/amino-acid N-acetyltransferase